MQGDELFEKIQAAKILVVGAGGIGKSRAHWFRSRPCLFNGDFAQGVSF
jgi:hypothetical protein